MSRNNPKRLRLRHGERLAALDALIERKEYACALEFMRRVLGDPTIPAETRVLVKAKEVEALLGLGRHVEAFVSASQVESLIRRHRLYALTDLVQGTVERARQARGA